MAERDCGNGTLHATSKDTSPVNESARVDAKTHVQIQEPPPRVRRRTTRKEKASVNNYAAAFTAKAKVERIQDHKVNLLRAFELIEKQRPKSIKPCKSSQKLRTISGTASKPVPVFDLSELMQYADVSTPVPSVEKLHQTSKTLHTPRKIVELQKLDRPQSAKAREPHDTAASERVRPQSAKDRRATKHAHAETEVQRLLQRYYSKFQPHLVNVKSWAVPIGGDVFPQPAPSPGGALLPHFHLKFRGLNLRNGGIPGFEVPLTPAFSVHTFVPRMLLSVDLAATHLSDAGCYAIASQLIHEPSITSIDVRANVITIVGVHVLLEAVKCRAMYHALNHRLAPISTLLLDNGGVDMAHVRRLVADADLKLTIETADAADDLVVDVAHQEHSNPPEDSSPTHDKPPVSVPWALSHAFVEPLAAPISRLHVSKSLPALVRCTPLLETRTLPTDAAALVATPLLSARPPLSSRTLETQTALAGTPSEATSDGATYTPISSPSSPSTARPKSHEGLASFLDALEASVHELQRAPTPERVVHLSCDAWNTAPAIAHQVAYTAAHVALHRLYVKVAPVTMTVPPLALATSTSSHPSTQPWTKESMAVVGSVAQQLASSSVQGALRALLIPSLQLPNTSNEPTPATPEPKHATL
ncbi:hypothetical protein ACHHYP_07736 [Achlya hypogyna]|uniref:Uncharacterized protein n=1 Tax=Achlya hypogyna TaxID=1202772 RepID=A0A1V9ZLI1_ACHHY|nr:hypothetical protein ACHHYP_07736 [Achlya hypogyna]